MKLISFVTPCYNEGRNLPLLVDEIINVVKVHLESYDFEIILVNDGSEDDTWKVILELSKKYVFVKGIDLSRNFGHQIALTAGLESAMGDVVIYFDSDLQHPPSVFPLMIEKWQEGFKIVHTLRVSTEGETWFKKFFSELFYNFVNLLSDTKINKGMADFKLLDRQVLDELNKLKEHNRFLRGLVPWLGFKSTIINYTARERIFGKPFYNFRRNITFAKTGILSFSVKPLKYIGYLGVFITFISLIILCFGVIISILNNKLIFSPTFFSTLILILFNGVLMSALGIISLYLAYVYQEVIGRTLYIIRKKTNDK